MCIRDRINAGTTTISGGQITTGTVTSDQLRATDVGGVIYSTTYNDVDDVTPDANGELFVSTDTSGTRIADGGTWSSIRQIRVYVNDTGGSSFENILTNTTTDSKIRIQTTGSDYGVFQVSTAASKTDDYYSIGFDDDSLLDSNGTYALDTLSIALDIQVNGEIFIDGNVIVDGSITADKIITSGITVTSNQVTGLGNLATNNTVSTNEVTGLGNLATDNTTLGNLAEDNTTLGNLAEANNINAGTDINAGSLPNSRLNANVSLLGNTGSLFTNTTNISGGQISLPNTPNTCLLYTSPSPRDRTRSRMPSSA